MKRLKLLLIIVAFSLVPAGAAMAKAANSGNGTTAEKSTNSTTEEKEDESASEDTVIHAENETTREASLQQRLEAAKEKVKTALDEAAKKRIEDRCGSAQTKTAKLENVIDTRVKRRNTAYDKLLESLKSLVAKLQAKNVDTAELEQEIAELELKIAHFKSDVMLYKQSITDLTDMNCTDDPSAFKSLLEQARTQHETAKADAAAIKDYFNNTMKPTLKKIHDALAVQDTDSGNTSTTEAN